MRDGTPSARPGADATPPMRRPGSTCCSSFNEAGVPSIGEDRQDGHRCATANPAITPVLTNPGDARASVVGAASSLQLSATDPNGDELELRRQRPAAGPGDRRDARARSPARRRARGNYNVVVVGERRHEHRDCRRSSGRSRRDAADARQPPAPAVAVTQRRSATLHARSASGTERALQWNFDDGTPDTAWSTRTTDHAHLHAARASTTSPSRAIDDRGHARSRRRSCRSCTCRSPRSRRTVVEQSAGRDPRGRQPRLWVVNQDNDTVSVFDAATIAKLGEVAVGTAPRTIARRAGRQDLGRRTSRAPPSA